jgi:hypothetical protein
MARSLYYGLVAIMTLSVVFALIIFNNGVSVIGDSVKAISELASVYDLDNISCALDAGHCNIN